MPPKGKGKGKKGGGGGGGGGGKKPAQKTDDDFDFDAILNEAAKDAEAPPSEEPAPGEASPADELPPAPSAEVEAAVEAEASPPVATQPDAAAAFLAQMGVGGDGSDKKDDKKKKDKKKGRRKDDGDKKGGEDEKPKQSKQGAAIAERLRKQQEEEERIRKEQEAEEARIAEEERLEAEEARRIEEEKERKKEIKRKKKEDQIKAGTYMTKAQKEKKKLEEARLEAMRAAGMLPTRDQEGEQKKKRPVYGKKKKPNQNKSVDKSADKDKDPDAAQSENAGTEAADVDKAAEEEGDVPDNWDADDAASPEKQKNEGGEPVLAAEEEDDGGDDWEAAADNWEEADDAAFQIQVGSDEEEDLVEKERLEEEAKAKAAAKAKRERDEVEKKRQEERAKLEAEAAAQVEDQSKADREAELKKLEARKRRQAREAEEAASRSAEDLRCPICCIMGHVDTGKTKLLDKIRRTNVQEGEAGGITQQIGATYFPGELLKTKTDKLNQLVDLDIKLPGLLVIDTPGHEAFANLRSRGSSLCDIAILVIDIMHGLEPQTIESIGMLRKKKCPFVVALNKVDRCYDWETLPDMEIRDALEQQKPNTRSEFQDRAQNARTQLMEQGLNAEIYWDMDHVAGSWIGEDADGTVAIVPTSAISGEGVNDLLHMLVRLTQTRMASSLMYSQTLQCTVLEVKVVPGMGCTVDVILVNGELHTGDTIVLCSTNGPVTTQVRALLTPPPSRELRIKSEYETHEVIRGAIGLKIAANDLENVVAGSPVMVVGPDDDENDIREEVMKDFASLTTNLSLDDQGVFAQASTLGALEALLQFLRHECDPPIPVAAANIGPIFKRDVMRAALMHEKKRPEFATILSFNVPIEGDAQATADELNVKIFSKEIIYHLFDNFKHHQAQVLEEERAKAQNVAVFPCLLQILKNSVFNAKDPIIMGVEVMDGILKVGTPLCIPKNNFLVVGKVMSIQCNHQEVERVKKGQQCAIQVVNEGNPAMQFGRHFTDEHMLYSELSRTSIDALKKYFKDDLVDRDWKLVIKLKKVFSII